MNTPETFNQDRWKRTGWTASLVRLDQDGGATRLIVRVATGRRFWPLFTLPVDFTMGSSDPALAQIGASISAYTHPMVKRFVDELETMLTDLYGEPISLVYRTTFYNQ